MVKIQILDLIHYILKIVKTQILDLIQQNAHKQKPLKT